MIQGEYPSTSMKESRGDESLPQISNRAGDMMVERMSSTNPWNRQRKPSSTRTVERESVSVNTVSPRLYPFTTTVGDLDVTFRRMDSADRDRMLAFTREIPERDLHFLRYDITDPQVVDEWIRNIGRGHTVTILAEESGQLIGYCSLHRSNILWTRHLGEIRMLVGKNYRGKGIGRWLVQQIFTFAQGMELLKLTVNMMSTQRDAQTLFHHLGFIPEALLHDWAIDRNGRTHDLIIMSREADEDLEAEVRESLL